MRPNKALQRTALRAAVELNRSTAMKSLRLLILALAILTETVLAGNDPPKPDFLARETIARNAIHELNRDARVCLSVSLKVLKNTEPLGPQDYEKVFADVKSSLTDPPADLLEKLHRPNLLPQSKCPEPDNNNSNWTYVILGPLRMISSDKVEISVEWSLDGFPTWKVCHATLIEGSWRFSGCTFVAQA